MASGKSLLQLARSSFSTAAASKLVKPPVAMYGIGGRYATALYSAASKQNKLQKVDEDMKKLLDLHEKDVKFREFMLNPLIKPAQKKEILGKGLQSKLNLDPLTLNLLGVMSENSRMKFFPFVARLFNKTMAYSRGELAVTITTASPMDAESQKELADILQSFAKDKKFIITYKTDKNILGGLIVDFDGERYVDMSIKRKFNQYVNLLRQPL